MSKSHPLIFLRKEDDGYMKVIFIAIIVFLVYFSFGLFMFIVSDSYDEAMDFIRGECASTKEQWISIFYTVIRHTPYNTYITIRNLINKILKGE